MSMKSDETVNTQAATMINLQEQLDNQPFSSYQWLIFILSFLVVAADGFDTGAIGFIAPSLVLDWGIDRPSLGPVLSAALVGMVFGALTAGPLADKLGRKIVVILSVLFFGGWSVASAFSSTLTELAIFRFLTGLGLGAAMPNIATLLSEFMPKRIRATMVNAMFCAFPAGIALGGFVSARLIPDYGWHIILLIGGAFPIALSVLIVLLMPESLHFMAIKNKDASKIAAILSKITRQPLLTNCTFEVAEKQNIDNQQSALALILSKPFRISTIMLWCACFMSLLVFYLLTSWLPILLRDAGFSVERASVLTAIFPVGGAVGTLMLGWLMDKMNANMTLVVTYFISGLLLLITSVSYQNPSLFGIAIFLTGVMLVGAQSSLPVLTAGFYPVQGRATGVSWMHGIGRFGAIFGAMIGAEMLRFDFGFVMIFNILAVPALFAAVALFIKGRIPITRVV